MTGALINPNKGFLPSLNYEGSSGYWMDGRSSGYMPGLGYPGDRHRAAFASASAPRASFASYGLTPSQQSSDPTTVSSVKSPLFQNNIQQQLSDLNRTQFNPNVNPYVTRANTKNPAIAAATAEMAKNLDQYSNPTDFTKSGQFQQGINKAYTQADADKAANREQFGSFLNLFKSQTPQVAANVNQENTALGDFYNGAVQGKLDQIAADRAAAVNLSANRALDRVGKNNALLRMTQGDGSYANKQAIDSAAAIYADEARQQAEQARTNYLYTKEAQARLMGARNKGLDYLSARELTPIQALSQLGASEDARLGGIGQMDLGNNIYTTPEEAGARRAALLASLAGIDNANTIYQVDSPQGDLARRTALLAQLQQMNLANNFYGLKKDYDPGNGGGVATYTNYSAGTSVPQYPVAPRYPTQFAPGGNPTPATAATQPTQPTAPQAVGLQPQGVNYVPLQNYLAQRNAANYMDDPNAGGYWNLGTGQFYDYGTPAV